MANLHLFMHPLLSLTYWFSLTPMSFMTWPSRILLAGFGVLFVGGIVLGFLESRSKALKPVKRAYARAASHLGWTGFVGLLLWIFDYERIPLLTMRAFYLVWLVWFVWGAWSIFRYVWKEIPAFVERDRERIEREKWLPKPKRT